jgi:phosphoribosyl-AMP cyclohydrolase
MMFKSLADFQPDFSKSGGLIAAVAQDVVTGEILMLAWMNEEAWKATLSTGEGYYWSRSRQKLWHKGESSGNVQKVRAIRLDCDSDAVVLEIEQIGGSACHTGRSSCFYRRLTPESSDVEICCPQVFDPEKVYKK